MSGAAGSARTRSGRGFLDRPMTSLHLVVATGGLLLAVGGVMVFSASMVDSYDTYGTTYAVFTKQLMWIAIGLPAFWLGLRLPPATYRRIAHPALLVCAALLLLVLVPGIGVYAHGARRWIDLGPLQVQPSEPAKLALALWGADLLVRRQGGIREWRHLLVPLVPVGTVLCALVMLEPDLGTTLCFILVLVGLLWTVGAPARLFAAFVGFTAFVVCVLIVVEPYRKDRLVAFLDPFQDRSNSGYQAVQGLYSLSTGGFFGAGLGQSKMKWGLLPNAHTDYIFAILGEELGLVGCLVVLALFATLAYTGLQRIPRRVNDPFVRLVSATVTVWLCGQALVNIGYVTGMLPVTGIPLPLISFGGTSLVLTMFVLGMLASFARHEPAAVAHLRSRPPGRLSRLLSIPLPSPTPGGRARPAVRRQPAAARTGRGGQPERRGRMKPAQAGTTRRTATTARSAQARAASPSRTATRGRTPARRAAPAVTLAPRPLTRGSPRTQRR